MIDVNSGTWLDIKARCRRGIENGQRSLAQTGTSQREDDVQRGIMSALQSILDAGEPAKSDIPDALTVEPY